MDKNSAAAEMVVRNRLDRSRLPALPAEIRPATVGEAYAVQGLAHAALEQRLGSRIGYKIGCTTAIMQSYLGIPEPCAAGLFEKASYPSKVRLDPAGFVQVGVECEIAVRLSRDLGPATSAFGIEEVEAAIDAYLPAIELVDDRYQDWRTIGTPTLVADDFFSAGCVLGSPCAYSRAPDLANIVGRIIINGQCVGSGLGRDVMGHPHIALTWLANHLAERGTVLKAGEIVLTGSLVQTCWLAPGDSATIAIEGLGDVFASLAPPVIPDESRD